MSLRCLTTLSACDERTWQAQWNPTFPILAVCSADKTVKLYSYTKKPCIEFNLLTQISTGHQRAVRAIAWSPGGTQLATASFDSTVGIWEQDGEEAEWECVSTVEGHENEVKSVAYSCNGTLLATSGRDKSVWIWEVHPEANFECAAVLIEHTQDVKCVTWHPTKEILASASYDDTIKLYMDDASDDWFPFKTLTGHASTVWSVAFSPDGQLLASSSDDETILVWKEGRSGWEPVSQLKGHTGAVYSVSWASKTWDGESKDRFWLASAAADGDIRVWDITNSAAGVEHKLTSTVTGPHETEVNHVAWNWIGDQLALASSGDDGRVKIWILESVE